MLALRYETSLAVELVVSVERLLSLEAVTELLSLEAVCGVELLELVLALR